MIPVSFSFFLYFSFLCCVVLCYVILILLILLIFTEYILLVLFYVSLIFFKNYFNFLLFLVFPGCSGMFKNFRVPGFIDVPNIQLSELFKVIRKKERDQSENVSYVFTSDHSYLKLHDFMLFVFNFWLHEEI